MNKKNFMLVILFLGICMLAFTGVYITNRNVQFVALNHRQLGVSIRIGSNEIIIKPYYNHKNKTYYYFLPSVVCSYQIYNDVYPDKISIGGKTINSLSCFEWEDGKVYTILHGKKKINATFMKSSDIAVLFLTTKSGSMQNLNKSSNGYFESGRIDVIEADGRNSYSGEFSLKVRGNSTFHFPKKAFNVKLKYPASILGMEKDKDFCLLANAWDYSYMNNKLAFDMAKKAGFRYSPNAEYADVYCNGEYWGLYLVAEKIELGENRINITNLEYENKKVNKPYVNFKSAVKFNYDNKRGIFLSNNPSDITGGYLIERDYRLRKNYPKRVMTTSYFETEDFGTSFNIKFPQYASKEEVDYISAVTNEMEQAIMSDDGFSKSGKYYLDYIDLDSWVKWYMIAEIAYDLDKDVTNTYYYKDRDSVDSKFYCGPVWDYDNRFGGATEYSYPNLLTKLAKTGWSHHLYERKEFFNEVRRDWISIFNKYLKVDAQTNINDWEQLIRKSVTMDNVRWNRGPGYRVRWPGKDNSKNFVNTYVFNDQVNHLRQWIEKRRIFLDSCWGDDR